LLDFLTTFPKYKKEKRDIRPKELEKEPTPGQHQHLHYKKGKKSYSTGIWFFF